MRFKGKIPLERGIVTEKSPDMPPGFPIYSVKIHMGVIYGLQFVVESLGLLQRAAGKAECFAAKPF